VSACVKTLATRRRNQQNQQATNCNLSAVKSAVLLQLDAFRRSAARICLSLSDAPTPSGYVQRAREEIPGSVDSNSGWFFRAKIAWNDLKKMMPDRDPFRPHQQRP
jgi:hypothetical protein